MSSSGGGEPPPEVGEERRLRRSTRLKTAYRAVKAKHAGDRSRMEALADRMIGFASSTPFLIAHGVVFVIWIFWNVPLSGLHRFDPYPFMMLTTIVSLEAIVLAIFVLMTQSREARIGELREELTLQINLRIEEELTKTLHLVAGLYSRLGLALAEDPELTEMLEPLDTAEIEERLMDQMREAIPQFQKRNRGPQKRATPPKMPR